VAQAAEVIASDSHSKYKIYGRSAASCVADLPLTLWSICRYQAASRPGGRAACLAGWVSKFRLPVRPDPCRTGRTAFQQIRYSSALASACCI